MLAVVLAEVSVLSISSPAVNATIVEPEAAGLPNLEGAIVAFDIVAGVLEIVSSAVSSSALRMSRRIASSA